RSGRHFWRLAVFSHSSYFSFPGFLCPLVRHSPVIRRGGRVGRSRGRRPAHIHARLTFRTTRCRATRGARTSRAPAAPRRPQSPTTGEGHMPERDDTQVLTPGGMRPKTMVHHVPPGSAVTGEDAVVPAEDLP